MTQKVGIDVVFDVTGKGELKNVTSDLKDMGKAGENAAPGVEKASSGASGLGGAVKGLIAGGALLAAGKQLLDFGKASINAASDVEEMQSKFSTVFGSLGGEVTNELTEFADAANRSIFDLQGFAATLQDTFVPLGFARDTAADMSVEVTKLAADLGSFNNLPTADVARDLQSALVGNTETLRKYGVIASQAAIEQEAITSGLWDGAGAIDAQSKAQAILNLTLKGTTDAQGDAIKTADSYANTSEGLAAAMTDLKVVIGQDLLPVMTSLKGETAGIVSGMTRSISTINKLNSAYKDGTITYSDWFTATNKARNATADFDEILQDVGLTTEGLTEEQERLNQRIRAQAVAMEAGKEAALEWIDAEKEAEKEAEELAARLLFLTNVTAASKDPVDEIAVSWQMLAEKEENAAAAAEALAAAEIEAANSTEGLKGAIRELTGQLDELGPSRSFLLSLGVEGLEGLQEAVRLAGTPGFNDQPDPRGAGDRVDPSVGDVYDRPEDRPAAGSSPTGNAAPDTNFASGIDSFTVPPGFPNDSFKAGLSSGETISVSPAGQSVGNRVSISQVFNGSVTPAMASMVKNSTEAALREAGIRGF